MGFQITDKRSVKEGMTIENVYDYLTSRGVSGKWIDTNTILFETACHNTIGEGRHKLYYYHNTKLFSCYTGCGTFDMFELIQKMEEVDGNWIDLPDAIQEYNDAQEFVFVGQGGDSYDSLYGETLYNPVYEKPEFEYYDVDDISGLARCYVKDWVGEGISVATQTKYGLRHNIVLGAAVFPHFDGNWNCLGIRQRLMAEEDVEKYGKYRPYNKGDLYYSSPLSFYVFGLNHNADNIRNVGKAIVYEGEKSVMKMDDVLGPNNNISVASFGMHFSRHQIESLKELGVEEITFAFDRQFKEITNIYKEYSDEFVELINIYKNIDRKFSDMGITLKFVVDKFMVSGYKDSPIDCGAEVFSELYQGRMTIKEIEEEFGI